MLYYERQLQKKGFNFIIGVDEAGRGPLAGPVVAAAAYLKTYRFKNRIDDSKKLTALSRNKAYEEIIRKSVFGIGVVDHKEIDRINIYQATRLAMRQATNSLLEKIKSSSVNRIHIIVDGNIPFQNKFLCRCIIKGDSKSKSIACASILAKVTRDRIMEELDARYPQYGFKKHKGYSTSEHRIAIKKFGRSEVHRESFCCE